ncbi:MAG: hypothetical protein B6226_03510 [Candidatus Cloacimonetes bacterium 4572_65]|nr:MAG: hypothetical protein B6226_03510 [Candidatus Cloacimonetes bacterium 4572_65]
MSFTRNIPRGASNGQIQIGSKFQTSDGTTPTANDSPFTYTTATSTIVVPTNAFEIILAPSSDLRVSESSDVSTYDLIESGTKESLGVAGLTDSKLYIKGDTAGGTLYFRFTMF